jgi:mRNA-degrading endonuclease toxin of MazEF toxin-antitoxin module
VTESPIGRGTVCWATVPAGFGHDQGTRPWVILSRLAGGAPRAIAVPISTDTPTFAYPVSWRVPDRWGLDEPSWVRIDHVRSLPVERLRDAFAETTRDELLELLDAFGALLDCSMSPR